MFDGSVARHRGEAKRSGAFMDSVLDRVSDMILFSCLFWSLADKGKARSGARTVDAGRLLGVSHVRAEAEAVGVTLTEGSSSGSSGSSRCMMGLLIPGMMLPALVALAVSGVITLAQRGFSAP